MYDSPSLWLASLAVVLINLPFGYWRAGLRRLSPLWFVAIHAPIPLAIGLRVAMGIPFRVATLPIFMAAFFGGQLLGAKLRSPHSTRS